MAGCMVDIHFGVKQIIRVNKKRGVPIRKYFEAVKKLRRTQMHGLPIRKKLWGFEKLAEDPSAGRLRRVCSLCRGRF